MTRILKRQERGWSIRTSLMVAVAALSVVGIASAGYNSAGAWQALRRVQAAQQADRGANQFAAGLFEVLMERLATNNALQAAEPAGPEVLREIERRRTAVRQSFDPGLAVLAAQQFAGQDALLRGLRGAIDQANDFRRRADTALKLPRSSRDEALVRDYIPTVTASVNAALAVWFAAAHAVAGADPVLARLAVVKELGWRARDTAGGERSMIASAIAAGQPVSAEVQASAMANRTRVDLIWSQINTLAPAADPATHPALREAIRGARQGYHEEFRRLSDEMVRAGTQASGTQASGTQASGIQAAGGRYPMDVQRYVETTTPQLGTLLEIMHAGGQASEARAATLVGQAGTTLAISLALLLLSLAMAASCAWLVVRRVTRPLTGLALTTARLARGDLQVAVPDNGRNDEVGAVADALITLRDGALQARALEAAAEASRAARQTRQETVARHTGDFGAVMGGMMGSLGTAVEQIRIAADEMGRIVGQTRTGTTATTQGAEEASRNLAAVAAATEQLSHSVSEISRQVAHVAHAVDAAVSRAAQTDATVRGLSVATSQISDVVRLIGDIAGQTNLLALNATIEAARAGDAGKGFAVVASEVKMLATQTAKATEQIGAQVAAIQAATDEAVAAVHEVSEAIGQVSSTASAIAAAVEQQGAATRDIAASVQAVAQQNDAATQAMREIAGVTESADDVARRVMQAANDVAKVSGGLRQEVDGFFQAIQATEATPSVQLAA